MKIATHISILLLTLISCESETSSIISYHDNGQIRELEIRGLDSIPNGQILKKIFHSNGNIKCQGKKLNGLREGKWICYYENGGIEWKGHYINGKENGEIECYYKDGTWQKFIVKDDLKNGQAKMLLFDSTLMKFYTAEGQYADNKEEGIWNYFDTANTKMMTIHHVNGKKHGEYTQYHKNGNVSIQGSYNQDVLDDTTRIYNEEEILIMIEIYNQGELNTKQIMR